MRRLLGEGVWFCLEKNGVDLEAVYMLQASDHANTFSSYAYTTTARYPSLWPKGFRL